MDITLLYKKVEGTLTPEEEQCFAEWMEEDARHRHYFASFERHFCGEEKYVLTAERKSSCREAFLRRLGQRRPRRVIHRYLLNMGRIAAVLILGLFVWHQFKKGESASSLHEGVAIEQPRMAETENHGPIPQRSSYGVTLIDEAGEDIPYEELGTWSKAGSAQLDNAGGLLSYVSEGADAPNAVEERFNEIVVDKGAEFSIRLSDGTQVWLNADSRLRYPVAFGKDGARRVYLQGEAYFDVSADGNHPFIVTAAGTDVTVYGTEFNIHARSEDYVRTTLVKGAVSVSVAGDTSQTSLAPGQTAQVNPQDGSVTLSEDPIELYVGWKQGKYYFEETPLKDLFAELSLWYDVAVVFTDESLEHECFSGCLSRHSSLDKILRILQETTYITPTRRGHSLLIGRGTMMNNLPIKQ